MYSLKFSSNIALKIFYKSATSWASLTQYNPPFPTKRRQQLIIYYIYWVALVKTGEKSKIVQNWKYFEWNTIIVNFIQYSFQRAFLKNYLFFFCREIWRERTIVKPLNKQLLPEIHLEWSSRNNYTLLLILHF